MERSKPVDSELFFRSKARECFGTFNHGLRIDAPRRTKTTAWPGGVVSSDVVRHRYRFVDARLHTE